MPYKETELHGPNFTRPPPDLIEGEQEFEVKKILDVQPRGQGRKMHFLVKWKGYPMSDNSWEPRENLHVDRLIAEYNKKKQRQAEPKKKGVKSRRARTEEKSPSSPINHHLSSSHRNIISAHSAPIVSSSTPSTPVTHTSMLPSPPREAASPSLISPIAPVVLTTVIKEEDVSDNLDNTSQGFPKAGEPKNSYKAYVSNDPEHVDDCSNCRVSHTTHTALDPQYWPLVLVEQLAQEQECKVRWDREGELLKTLDGDSKARVGAGATDTSAEEEQDPLNWKHNVQSQPLKIEIQVTIKVEDSLEEGMGGEKLKKKASRTQECRCYNCQQIGHIMLRFGHVSLPFLIMTHLPYTCRTPMTHF